MARLENLLGAQSLALADRLLADAAGSVGAAGSSSDCAALVTLLAHPGPSVGWLGEVLGLTSSGVTRLVERLVRAGWVRRSASGQDARSRRLELTGAGTSLAERVLAGRHAVLSRALAALSPSEQATLEELLGKMVASLTDELTVAYQVCRLCDRTACRGSGGGCPLRHTVGHD
ncbi:MAG TPA: MarR family transcriptional regulator [Pseudonocardia sp.]|uniref:MarR family winged helix-turn-helix transcriptional regulator n=1 Tax=Pseudonocardia sp. TaxID=60912 RepID=UPI002ED8CDD2